MTTVMTKQRNDLKAHDGLKYPVGCSVWYNFNSNGSSFNQGKIQTTDSGYFSINLVAEDKIAFGAVQCGWVDDKEVSGEIVFCASRLKGSAIATYSVLYWDGSNRTKIIHGVTSTLIRSRQVNSDAEVNAIEQRQVCHVIEEGTPRSQFLTIQIHRTTTNANSTYLCPNGY
ncbi:hypothetical protein ACHAWO_007072 [Cyclotella atomus]|uniref:Uncharacterized protein n=1 Tax=Cyclotella atomus TaxID=382360 RepID=A0ABD3MNV9_9STRA